MKVFSVLLSLLLGTSVSAQAADFRVDRVEHATDTSRWSGDMYSTYSFENYLEYPPFLEQIDLSAIDYPLLNAALFYETNRVRAEHDVHILEWNLQLEITAYNHSLFMVDNYEFAHYSGSSERRSPANRAALAGVQNPAVQENLGINFALDYIENTPFYIHARGVYSYDNDPDNALPLLSYHEFARRALALWMESPPHRRNVLSEKAVQLGTGAFLYREANAGYFPKFRTTQNFQWFTDVIPGESRDPLPPGYQLNALERIVE